MTSRPPRTRLRRFGAVALAAVLAVTAAGCGDDVNENADPTGVTGGSGLEALKVEGDFGKEPKLTWDDSVTLDEVESKTLIEGDGEPVESGDSILTHMLVANGVDQQVTSSDFGQSAQILSLGSQSLPVLNQSLAGVTEGSRVLVAAPSEETFGENGNPQLGIGNADTVVFVLDVDSRVPTEPQGKEAKAPDWVPQLTETDGKPTGFRFKGTPKPAKDLQVATLVEGDGEPVKKGQTLYVNYLGQVYGGKQPFDSSWSKGQPLPFELGKPGIVKGWSEGLEGVTTGSRVVLSIPPELGYGKKGNPQAGIKGTDTMYFVIDVLAAS